MFKKVLIASLAVVIGLAVVANTRMGSHVRLWWKGVKSSMAKKVPAEREIARLRMEVANLEKEDARFYDLVAKQRIEVREAEEQLTKNKDRLASLGARLSDLHALLKENGKSEGFKVSYKGNEFSLADLKKQRDLDFDRFEPLEALVKSQEKALTAKKAALAQNEKKSAWRRPAPTCSPSFRRWRTS
jgi:chromosome segregation ATPase